LFGKTSEERGYPLRTLLSFVLPSSQIYRTVGEDRQCTINSKYFIL